MTSEPTGVERARTELAQALDAIEYKLNVPKRAAERLQDLRKNKPLALVGLVVGAAAVVGGAVWFAVRTVRLR